MEGRPSAHGVSALSVRADVACFDTDAHTINKRTPSTYMYDDRLI